MTTEKKLAAWVEGFTKAANALGIHDTAAVNSLMRKCFGLKVAADALAEKSAGPLNPMSMRGLLGRSALIGGGLLGGKALFDNYATNNAFNFEPGSAMHSYALDKKNTQINSRASGILANESLQNNDRLTYMSPEGRHKFQLDQAQNEMRRRMQMFRMQSAADREMSALRNPRYTPQTWLGAGANYSPQQSAPTGLW